MTREEFAPILSRLRGLFPCSFPAAKANDMNSTAAVNARALWGGINAELAADVGTGIGVYVENLVLKNDGEPTFLDAARLIAIVRRIGRERTERESSGERQQADDQARQAAIGREDATRKSLAREDNFKEFSDADLAELKAEILLAPPVIRWPGDPNRDFMLNSGAIEYLGSVDVRRSPTWKAIIKTHLENRAAGRTILTIEAD